MSEKRHANHFRGERLKDIRLSRGLTRHQLGKVFGFTESWVRNYETGKNIPPDENEKKLCEYFNVDKDYFRRDEVSKEDNT